MTTIYKATTLILFAALAACSTMQLPGELVEVNEMLSNKAWTERVKTAAPEAFAESEKYRQAAAAACADNEKESCEHNAAMARLQLRIAEEQTMQIEAEKRRDIAETREVAAKRKLAQETARKNDFETRIARMERVAQLQSQLSSTASQAEAAQVRLKLEEAKRQAQQAALASQQEKLDVFLERGGLFEASMAIVGNENVKQTFRGIVLTVRDLFAPGKTEVLPAKAEVIGKISELAKQYSGYPIVVEGYTDNRGRQTANLALSQGRAQAVLDMMVSQGIETSRIRSAGYGKDRPISDNGNEAGRALNRRVEIVFLFAQETPSK